MILIFEMMVLLPPAIQQTDEEISNRILSNHKVRSLAA